MSRADDIIRGSRDRSSSSGETQRKAEETMKKIDDQRDYIKAKMALSDPCSGLDKQAKKELKELAKETKKSQTSWQERVSARDSLNMSKGARDRENPPPSACFIATAVYGDENAQQVQALRNYRDKVMMESYSGRSFVKLYYGGLGEFLSYFIAKKTPRSIPLIKKGLDLFVENFSR